MISSREKVNAVFERRNVSCGAFWTGHPSDNTVPIFAREWNIEPTHEAIYSYLNDDCRWIRPDWGYKHPQGMSDFNPSYGIKRNSLSAGGCFADAQTISDIEFYPWPNPEYCDFTEVYAEIDKFQDKMIFTGL